MIFADPKVGWLHYFRWRLGCWKTFRMLRMTDAEVSQFMIGQTLVSESTFWKDMDALIEPVLCAHGLPAHPQEPIVITQPRGCKPQGWILCRRLL